MFENLLGQKTADLLIHDIKAGVLSPAMLFTGPEISGKGTAALELARIISCEEEGEKRALWNCKCSACARHRFLIHADLLCMGPKDFFQDISASGSALKNEINADCGIGNTPEGILFIRSVRKLLLRFNPVLWEDDPKTGKISSLVNSLEDDLDEFHSVKDKSLWQKLADGILKNANKLESEAISENIPVAQLRNAAYWGRLAPSGRGKVLVIENADRMQEEGKNSLLKLLEEPPGYLYIILTTSRQGSMLPTVLSRLRQYRFYSRDGSIEAEVIRRVFRYREYIIPEQTDPSSPSVSLGRGSLPEPAAEQGHLQVARRGSPPGDENPAGNTISSYLESFLPVSGSKLKSLAAFFAASVSYKAALLSKKNTLDIPNAVVLLGKSSAPLAEAAGYGRPLSKSSAVIGLIMEQTGGFEIRALFSRFLMFLYEQASQACKNSAVPVTTAYNDMWIRNISWADSSVKVYKLRPLPVLEKLFTALSREMTEL